MGIEKVRQQVDTMSEGMGSIQADLIAAAAGFKKAYLLIRGLNNAYQNTISEPVGAMVHHFTQGVQEGGALLAQKDEANKHMELSEVKVVGAGHVAVQAMLQAAADMDDRLQHGKEITEAIQTDEVRNASRSAQAGISHLDGHLHHLYTWAQQLSEDAVSAKTKLDTNRP